MMQSTCFEGERYTNLNEVFHVLLLRLNDISKGDMEPFDWLFRENENEFYNTKIETIERNVLLFPNTESIGFIEGIIVRIFDLKNSVKEIIDLTNEKGSKIFAEGGPETIKSINKITKELDFYQDELQKIKLELNRALVLSVEQNPKRNLKSNKKKINDELLSFGFTKQQIPILKKIYLSLIFDKADFVNKEKTSEEAFINILTTRDVRNSMGTIHFECETTQVAYILKCMRHFSKKISYANIDRSKIFYTKNGEILTATNISKSISINDQPKQKEYIDSFFADLKLKP